jgi:hypothetical protein
MEPTSRKDGQRMPLHHRWHYHGNANDDAEPMRNGCSSPSHKEKEEYGGDSSSSRFKAPTLDEVTW